MSETSGSVPTPRRPKPFAPIDFEPFEGGTDPSRISEAAHLAAHALVQHGRASDDPEVTKRLIKLADRQGIEVIAELWAEAPAHSLPGALWRLYALRTAIAQNPDRMALYFNAGKDRAEVSQVVAGAAEPPGAEEIRTMSDAILSGAFNGDFDVALERFAAFCRVIALGQASLADAAELGNEANATKLTKDSHRLLRTAEDLEYSAKAWRDGHLD